MRGSIFKILWFYVTGLNTHDDCWMLFVSGPALPDTVLCPFCFQWRRPGEYHVRLRPKRRPSVRIGKLLRREQARKRLSSQEIKLLQRFRRASSILVRIHVQYIFYILNHHLISNPYNRKGQNFLLVSRKRFTSLAGNCMHVLFAVWLTSTSAG